MKTPLLPHFICLLLYFFSINTQAQIFNELQTIEPLPQKKIFPKEKTNWNRTNPLDPLTLDEVIPVPDKGFVFFKSDNQEAPKLLELSFYDLNIQKIHTKKIPTARTNELFTVEQTFIWNNSLILLASLYHIGPQKNHLLYYQYSLPNFQLEKSEVVLESKAPSDVYVPYFTKLSPDKSKLLLVGWNYSKPKENANLSIKIVDKNLSEIRRQPSYFNFQNQRISIEDVFVDNAANVFITGNNYLGDLFDEIKPRLLDHFVVGLFPDKTSKVWAMKNDKNYFSTLQYALTTQGDLIGTGFLQKDGFGYFKIDAATKSLTAKTKPVSKEIFDTAYSKNAPNFKLPKHKFRNYEFRKLIIKEDAIYIIGEQVPYHYGLLEDILVAKLNLAGTLEWLNRLPKKQIVNGSTDFYASFALLERQKKLYFVFNDEQANYQKEASKKLKATDVLTSIKTLTPTVAEINLASGKVKRRQLKNLMDSDYVFLPQHCQVIGKEDVLFLGIGTSVEKSGSFFLKKVKIRE